MDAAVIAYANSIAAYSTEQLRQTCITVYREKLDLSRRTMELENSSTEMALQFQQMKMERDAALYENEELKKQNVHLTHVLALREQEMFGKSSEKVSGITDSMEEETRDPLDEGANAEQNSSAASRDECDPDGDHRRGSHGSGGRRTGNGRKPKVTREELLAGLPVQNVYDIDIKELNRLYGEGNWRIANWHPHNTVEYVKASSFRRVIHTPVISVGLDHRMITIPWEKFLIPKSFATSSLVAQIMLEWGGLHLPIYRQEHDPDHFGFPLSRQTACNWVVGCAQDYLAPVYHYLCRLLRDQPYQQCDETTWRNLHPGENAGKIQYMWVHCTSELSNEKRIIAYCYEDSRSAEHLRKFYAELNHAIHLSCDAFSAYSAFAAELAGLITLCGCMMHCRRRFYDAYQLLPKTISPNQRESSPEWTAILLIGDLYKHDEMLKGLTCVERLTERCGQVAEKMDAFLEFVHEFDMDRPDVSDKMKDAIGYTLNQEEQLRQFLTDGSVPLDNGEAERHVKCVALSRKSSLFSNTTSGANAVAMLWTLIETARAHDADAYYYLKYLLDEMPKYTRPTANDPPGYLDRMLPWSEEYRSYEREQKQMMIRCQVPPDQKRPTTPGKRKPTLKST